MNNELEMKSNSLSVIIPAYNEADGLRETFAAVIKALSTASISDYEILLMTVTDPSGKHDGTPDLAALIADNNPNVKHLHTPFFAGLGYKFRQGINAATKEYIMWVPGHDLTEGSSLTSIMLYLGQSDAIFTYTGNPEVRPYEAQLVSKCFVMVCNILFGLNLKYYNGISVIKRDLLKSLPLTADDYSCFAESLVYTIKSSARYIEIPQILKTSQRTGRAWEVDNALRIAGSLLSLFWRVNIKDGGFNSEMKAAPSLPEPQGLPDLGTLINFSQSSAVITLHNILVYLAQSVASYLGLSQGSNTSDRSMLIANIDKFLKIAGTGSVFIGKTLLKISTSRSNNPQKLIKKTRNKKDKISLSVVMPARQESDNLRAAYQITTRALEKAGISDYEILIATVSNPDGTPDDTHLIAKEIADKDSRVKSLHSEQFYGIGYKYREAVTAAIKKYVMLVPGDAEFEEDSIVKLLSHIGKAEVIIPFIGNPEARPVERQMVSQGFVNLCNMLFGLNLKYYNGLCIIPIEYLRTIPMSCDNFAYMAEILIYLVKSGVKYVEVPWNIKPSGNSKAFNSQSVTESLETLVSLFWKINVEGSRISI